MGRDVPLRRPGPHELLVRVRAAGVNFADLVMRQGLYATVPPRPYSPGFEVAGEVEEVGTEAAPCKPGDPVVALMRYGGYAERVVVGTNQVFKYPPALSPALAAAVPVVFLTAWICLFEAARARAGETALVLGAAGGVGTAAVQLAKSRGLQVIGTAGGEAKCAFVRNELGAAACADSRTDWETRVREIAGPRGIDVALDPVGGPATASCRRLLAPLGRLVFFGLSSAIEAGGRNWLRVARAWLSTPRFHPYSLVEPNIGVMGVHLLHLGSREGLFAPALEEIFRGVTAGTWRPIVNRVFPLTQAGAVAAHRHLHARQNVGKVVLVVEETA